MPSAATVQGMLNTAAVTRTTATTSTAESTFTGAVTATGGLTVTTTAVTITDVNIVLSATTGTKIGTAVGQKLGFFNATPAVQQAVLTTQLTTITITDAAGTPDYALSALTTTTPYGLATLAEAVSLLYVIKNLQVRVAELEARLITYGLLASA